MKYKVYVDWLTQWGKDYLSHLKQIFQGKLTAGQGVTIDENNVISASSTGDEYMLKENPVGSGSLSMNRKEGTTVGTNSVALGTDATASGTNSLAGGRQAVASGFNSLAYGDNVTASADGAIALGNNATASGTSAVALGFRPTASGGGYSVALGNHATASGISAVALGFRPTASGKYSVALSGGTTSGDYTLAMGRDTEAHYDYSIALGRGLITTHTHQVVIGEYNATNNYASFVIGGGGSSESRWNTMWVEGNDMYIQGTNGNNPLSVVNIKYLKDNYKLADISTLEAELVEIYNSTAAYTNAAD
jgi:autotransporter adhesin